MLTSLNLYSDMTELLAFLASNGPAVYPPESKEYQLIDSIDDWNEYESIEEYLSLIGYSFFYESSSDCWVVMEKFNG